MDISHAEGGVRAAEAQRPAGLDERIYGPFEARVRGRGARGERFDDATTLDDVSAVDFSLCLPRPHAAGARLFVVTRLGRARVALRGVVLSAAEREGGCRLHVSIKSHRFLP